MATIIFSPGDVVRLKSGGPPMTVNTLRNGGDAIVPCEWFAGDILRRDEFDSCNLLHYQPVPVLAVA